MIKVVVVDGDDMFRAGICSVLQVSGAIEVVAQTAVPSRMTELVVSHQPDVVVVDVTAKIPSDVEGIRSLHDVLPTARVVALTPLATNELAYCWLTAGVAGLLEKTVSPQELVNVVTAVAAGESVVMSPSIAQCMIDRFLRVDPGQARVAQERIKALTMREQEVLTYVARGFGNAEIARRLFLSEGAVKAHVSHLLTKMGCTNRVQAAIIACDSGMLKSRTGATPSLSSLGAVS